MIFYSTHSKELYVSSDYKLDEGRYTPTAFNLYYDGGIFIGLYTHNNSTSYEAYPEGTSVLFTLPSSSSSSTPVNMRGTVISIPIPKVNSRLPMTDNTASPYVIRLVDGSIHQVSPDTMDLIVVPSSITSQKLRFPSWLGANQRVMYLSQGTYLKGTMEWNLDSRMWRFSQRRKNGTELFGVDLPNFCQDFQHYIDDGSLVPGWHTGKSFSIAGASSHVSASTLISLVPPGSTVKALHKNNPDKAVWLDSYREEYDGLMSNSTFDVISEEEFRCLQKHYGIRAIPSMCIFTVKHHNGVPTRAKSRVVVLGNLEQKSWSKTDCFSPVFSIPMIRLLTALAVHNGRTLKQADCKFAFIQATLPSEEVTVVKPPLGCPFLSPRQYWQLKKSLYGLRRAPRHWYNLLGKF
jgi:hypothetical protein